jgi:nucleoside-diphosphate-sugar epimerase
MTPILLDPCVHGVAKRGQAPAMTEPERGLTVTVTGPTGDIGRAFLAALERSGRVSRVVGMARRPFDLAEHGWTKVEYRQGDVLDPNAVERLVTDADVVVHLAFIIFGDDREKTREVNLEGSTNVFRAAVERKVGRLVYTSSVAAYGFHPDNPELLTEAVPLRGTDGFYYSAQKAELESRLYELLDGSGVETYVFRPCIVAGRDALTLVTSLADNFQLSRRVPFLREVVRKVPFARPLLPAPAMPLQLVHHDDVAGALLAAVEGRGTPGVYNLAGPGTVSMSDVARELGWQPIPVPDTAVQATAALVDRLGRLLPQDLAWIQAVRVPVLMDTAKATHELGWRPQHDAQETLRETVAAARAAGIV